jgi:hypothetical protein
VVGEKRLRPQPHPQLSTLDPQSGTVPSTLNSQLSTRPNWSGQSPTGCKEIPAARLTQELAACLRGQQRGFKKGVGPEVGMGVVVETTPPSHV